MNTDPQQTYLQVAQRHVRCRSDRSRPTRQLLPTCRSSTASTRAASSCTRRLRPTTSPSTRQGSAFKSAALRRAVNYAIDRPALLRVRGVLGGSRTTTILPSSLTGGVYNQKLYPIAGADIGEGQVARR